MKNNIQKINIILIIVTIFISLLSSSKVFAQPFLPTPANAVTPTSVNPTQPTTPTGNRLMITPPIGGGTAGGTDLRTIFMNVLDIAQTIMIMVATLYLLYAGFMFVTAKGDPGRLKKAQDALLWGLVGAALILTAEVLALGIGDTVKQVFQGQ